MKTLARILVIAAGLAAALPAGRAADEPQPPPPPASGGPNAAAQPDQPGRGGWRGRRMDLMQRMQRMTEALGLTDEQRGKIKAIFTDSAQKRQAIMNDAALSPEDRRAKMMALAEDMRTRVRATLTPEQQAKFDAMPRAGRWHRGGGPGGEPPPPPPASPPANSNPPAGGTI